MNRMATEQELLDRIRLLELENSELRDKLDMIYAIVAPEDHIGGDDGAEDGSEDKDDGDLVQIKGVN